MARHSRPLDRMINGQMAETQKGYAVLEDVDKGTFERFIEWAYKGYYTAAESQLEYNDPPPPGDLQPTEGMQIPCPENRFSSEGWPGDVPADPPADPPEQAHAEAVPNFEMPDGWGGFNSNKKNKKGKTGQVLKGTRQELKESFICRKNTVRRDVISIPPTRANQSANEDYTEVFLSHARLYVFAEKYDIQLLKMLAFEELHNTLAIYTLFRTRTRDIVDLLRYVYANTNESAKAEKGMRRLLRDYVGYEMDVLMKDEEFKDLMVEYGGSLLGDFMKVVAKRIN